VAEIRDGGGLEAHGRVWAARGDVGRIDDVTRSPAARLQPGRNGRR
jgi:hypothetical protein